MRNLFWLLLIVCFPVFSQFPKTVLVETSITSSTLETGQQAIISIHFKLADKWLVYPPHIDENIGSPLSITGLDEYFIFDQPIFPKSNKVELLGETFQAYDSDFTITLPVRPRPGLVGGEYFLEVEVSYQGCCELVCMTPIREVFSHLIKIKDPNVEKIASKFHLEIKGPESIEQTMIDKPCQYKVIVDNLSKSDAQEMKLILDIPGSKETARVEFPLELRGRKQKQIIYAPGFSQKGEYRHKAVLYMGDIKLLEARLLTTVAKKEQNLVQKGSEQKPIFIFLTNLKEVEKKIFLPLIKQKWLSNLDYIEESQEKYQEGLHHLLGKKVIIAQIYYVYGRYDFSIRSGQIIEDGGDLIEEPLTGPYHYLRGIKRTKELKTIIQNLKTP